MSDFTPNTTAPLPAPRFLSLWALNGRLDLNETARQLRGFAAAGLDGVVLHPRNYPDTPAYLSESYFAVLSEVILQAKALGLRVWIYDENGWPSGTAGGRMLAEHPEIAQQWLELVEPDENTAAADIIQVDGNPRVVVVRVGTGVDYLAQRTGKLFTELTYEAYRTGLTPPAWEHVEAFFDDEPEFGLGHAYSSLSGFGAIPWTPDLLRSSQLGTDDRSSRSCQPFSARIPIPRPHAFSSGNW